MAMFMEQRSTCCFQTKPRSQLRMCLILVHEIIVLTCQGYAVEIVSQKYNILIVSWVSSLFKNHVWGQLSANDLSVGLIRSSRLFMVLWTHVSQYNLIWPMYSSTFSLSLQNFTKPSRCSTIEAMERLASANLGTFSEPSDKTQLKPKSRSAANNWNPMIVSTLRFSYPFFRQLVRIAPRTLLTISSKACATLIRMEVASSRQLNWDTFSPH